MVLSKTDNIFIRELEFTLEKYFLSKQVIRFEPVDKGVKDFYIVFLYEKFLYQKY